jgi:hypothetical protein
VAECADLERQCTLKAYRRFESYCVRMTPKPTFAEDILAAAKEVGVEISESEAKAYMRAQKASGLSEDEWLAEMVKQATDTTVT